MFKNIWLVSILTNQFPPISTILHTQPKTKEMADGSKKQKFIDSFFQRSVRSRAGAWQTVETVQMPKSNVGAQFACDLCPKMCGNAGSLAVHKSMIHPTNPTPASSSFFVPRQASACPKFPTPFWKQLFVVGVAYVAVVMAGRARFERYIPPPPRKVDGRATNKGSSSRGRKNFSTIKITAHLFSTLTWNPPPPQKKTRMPRCAYAFIRE